MRFLVAFCVLSLLISGCGSDGDNPAPAGTDLTGVWQTTQVVTGSPAPKATLVPQVLNLTQNGNTITGHTDMFGFTGTFDGTNLNCTGTMLTATITLTFVVTDGNTFGGTMSIDNGGAITNYQLTFTKKGAPTGTLSFNGTMNGVDISLNSTTAFAGVPNGATNARYLYHIDANRVVRIYITTVGDITPMTYTLTNNPMNAGEASMSVSHAEGTGDVYGDNATGGSLTITSVTADTISGTFNVTGWGTSGSLTSGVFSIPTLFEVIRL